MMAIIARNGKEFTATLAYIAKSKNFGNLSWRQATIAEFNKYHDFDDLCGLEGDALASEDRILCLDGRILGKEILEKNMLYCC